MRSQSSTTSSATKRKLLDAGVELIRTRGFNGTTVDDICKSAGVTKGGFFHYFESKDEVADAALATFAEARAEIYRDAPFRNVADPLERVYARLDFEKELIEATAKTRGCLAGMLAQELAASREGFREACHDFFLRRIDDFAADLAAAKAMHAPKAAFDPRSVATFYQSVTQGSHILAKVSGDNAVRLENIEHFRAYVRGLFAEASASAKPLRRMRSGKN